jgi:DNA-binding LacI/PurR family transcriptional regulator
MKRNGPPKRVTMADIARLAGVSPSTVSRALGDYPLVDARTRERVREIARQHNYEVNIGARNFRLRRSRTLALALPAPDADALSMRALAGSLITAVATAAADAAYALQLVPGGQPVADYASMLDACRADGIAALPGALDACALDALAATGAPVVAFGGDGVPDAVCTVAPDIDMGARALAGHLAARGRRRALVLSPAPARAGPARRFPDACHGALTRQGLQASALTLEDVGHADIGARLVTALARTDPDVIVAPSDLLALTALGTLQAQGLDVPGAVAVTGCGDSPLAAHVQPALTSLDLRLDEVGRLMIDRLIALVEGEPCDCATVAPRLVPRGSTAAPDAESACRADAPQACASPSADGTSGRI